MTFPRAILVVMLLALPMALTGEEFAPAEFFGDGHFTPHESDPARGNLRASLTGPRPEWLEWSGSGRGSAAGRFTTTNHGLRLAPDDEHRTLEINVDAGVVSLDAGVSVHELQAGGSVAWHIRGRGDGRDYLVELKSLDGGGHLMRVRVRTPARFVVVPGVEATIDGLDLPVEFRLRVTGKRMIAEIGDAQVDTSVEFEAGISAAIAVSDKPAVLRDLSMDVHLHEEWIAEAAAKLAARKALARLREMATLGLLGGIHAGGFPGAEEMLEHYSPDQREARAGARRADLHTAADKLAELADALPEVAMAQHEAGLAALMAGRPATARTYLRKARDLKPVPVILLALAEAYRRTGDVDAAQGALAAAGDGLPGALRPDYALIKGRLLADRGQLKQASKLLNDEARVHGEHGALGSFAASAAELTNPERLAEIELEAPLGLTLLSDLPAGELEPLLARLAPYMKALAEWLPVLDKPVAGTIAIYASPVDYLRAALVVASDNIDHVAGMYLRHGIADGPTVMACRGFGEDELVRTLVHEIWHLALAATGRDARIPRWLNEGMAVFLSAGRVEQGRLHWDVFPAEFEGMEGAPGMLDAEMLARAVKAGAHTFYIPGEVRENYFAGWSLVWYYATTEILNVDLQQMLKGDAEAISNAIRGDDMADRINARLTRHLRD